MVIKARQDLGRTSPFNSALEVGIRAVVLLNSFYPRRLQLSEIALYDYFVIHTADAAGPPSLHPSIPSRHGEYFIRRGRIEAGLSLMRSVHMVHFYSETVGATYEASEKASALIDTMTTSYNLKLKECADWLSIRSHDEDFKKKLIRLMSDWNNEMKKV